jgi:hypothetical protein
MVHLTKVPLAGESGYTPPKGIGYFMNILGKLNAWIERENKRGSDIPRFTKVQIRRIALFMERHHLFNFNALRKVRAIGKRPAGTGMGQGPMEPATGPAPVQGVRPTWNDQVREFKRIIKEQNRKLPSSVLDDLIQ